MRFLRTDGKEVKAYQWRCGACKNDIVPNLVYVLGGPTFPNDIPINCPNCFKLVAMFNPPPEVLEDPPVRNPAPPTLDNTLPPEPPPPPNRLDNTLPPEEPPPARAGFDPPPQW
jgi:hypothetical protein